MKFNRGGARGVANDVAKRLIEDAECSFACVVFSVAILEIPFSKPVI